MKILVSHVNYPSQFRRLLSNWSDSGHDVVFLAREAEWHACRSDKFRLIFYKNPKLNNTQLIHPYLRRLEDAVQEGQAAYRAAMLLSNSGWYPDVVVSHVGFGNGFFLKDCFPLSRRIGIAEWFYNAKNSDVDFLNPSSVSSDHKLQLRIWNAECLIEMASLDAVVVPTKWQCKQFPPLISNQINVIHEGVDTELLGNLKSSNTATFDFLPNDPNIEILTYVSRCFEHYRGFPQAVSAIAKLLNQRPNLHVLMVGADGSAYGSEKTFGQISSNWAREQFSEHSSRVHWLGLLQECDYHKVLAISDVHFYLTVPFILSWSLIEAMAASCSIVASATPPVLEVLRHGHSALLVDFFDVNSQFQALDLLLSDRLLARRLSTNARKDSLHYSCRNGFEAWNRILTNSPGASC